MDQSGQRSGQAHVAVQNTPRPDVSLVGLLRDLRRHPERTRQVSTTSISVAVLGISPNAGEPWLRELARYQRACGCNLGAAGAVAGFVLASAWQVTHIRQLTVGALVVDTVEVLAVAIVCAVLGKLVGLALARTRFQRATEILIAQVLRPANNGA